MLTVVMPASMVMLRRSESEIDIYATLPRRRQQLIRYTT